MRRMTPRLRAEPLVWVPLKREPRSVRIGPPPSSSGKKRANQLWRLGRERCQVVFSTPIIPH